MNLNKQDQPTRARSRELREVLEILYPAPDDGRRVVTESGALPRPDRVDYAGGATTMWFRILQEVDKHGHTARRRLHAFAAEEYPEVLVAPGKPPPDDDVLGPYLDFGWKRHRRIQPIGYRNAKQVYLTLDEVFVDLQVQVGRRLADCDQPWRMPGTDQFEQADKLDLTQALARVRHEGRAGLVLLGDPGAGKTTLLKHIFCKTVAEGSASMGLDPRLVPVLLRWSSILPEEQRERGLATAVCRVLAKRGYPQAGEALAVGDRPMLFLLDGLDEVRDSTTRAALCRWLEREVDHYKDSAFVATCRFSAWQKDARLATHFLAADVQWLSEDPGIPDYVRRWTLAVELGLGGRPDKAAAQAHELLQTLQSPRWQSEYRLRQLAQNPLLLGVLCLVHTTGDRLPDRRERLYDACVSFLLEDWTRKAGRPGLDNVAARQALQPLAWAMHRDDTRTYARSQVEAVLAPVYPTIPALQDMGMDEFLARARDDCGLLVGAVDADHHICYEFLHLSFQEYLAACHARASGCVADLVEHLGEPRWEEVILLAMALDGAFAPFMAEVVRRGKLAQHKTFLRRCLGEAAAIDPKPFLVALQPAARPWTWAWCTDRLAGRRCNPAEAGAVLELFRERGIPAIQTAAQAWVEHAELGVLAREVAGLTDDTEAPQALGASEAFTEPTTGMVFLPVASGRFWMGSSNDKAHASYDAQAFNGERPAHEVELTQGYWLGRFPVTNAQYARYLEDADEGAPLYWDNRRFNAPDQPVVAVSWDDARSFCAWLTRTGGLPPGLVAELPTEAQWERAARGDDQRRWPWGNQIPDEERCEYLGEVPKGISNDDLRKRMEKAGGTRQTAAVDAHPSGAGPYRHQDLAGNIWEWCQDAWRDDYGRPLALTLDPVYDPPDGDGDGDGDGDDSPGRLARVVRGGSWSNPSGLLRCACRVGLRPEDRGELVGFRVCCRPSREHGA